GVLEGNEAPVGRLPRRGHEQNGRCSPPQLVVDGVLKPLREGADIPDPWVGGVPQPDEHTDVGVSVGRLVGGPRGSALAAGPTGRYRRAEDGQSEREPGADDGPRARWQIDPDDACRQRVPRV